jgi:hypothetical protein
VLASAPSPIESTVNVAAYAGLAIPRVPPTPKINTTNKTIKTTRNNDFLSTNINLPQKYMEANARRKVRKNTTL